MAVTGYKALNPDMSANYGHIRFELNKPYSVTGKVTMCENGFHFCRELEDIEGNYTIKTSRIFEIEASGDIVDGEDKSCAETITLIKELSREEIHDYFETNMDRILAKPDFYCRKALAAQGIALDRLLTDKDGRVRAAVARQEYGLETLVTDPDWFVRKAVAEHGYSLHTLVNDPDWRVRTVVAGHGYGLEKLSKDNDTNVRYAVMQKLKELQKK